MAYYIYIMTNKHRTIYTGATNDLERRVYEHKNKILKGFTAKYNVDKLIYYEEFVSPIRAIKREKEIKKLSRANKMKLIATKNPKMHFYQL